MPRAKDRATLSPEVTNMWHPTRNDASPSEVAVGSKRKRWWRCTSDPRHEWQASPLDLRHSHRCTVCAGRQVMAGVNDLETTHPDVVDQWHPSLNFCSPNEVVAGSGKKV